MPPHHIKFTLLLVLLFFIRCSHSLECFSTVCASPDEHGLCLETCRGPNQACYANFYITPNHTVTAGSFRCHDALPDQCLSTTCQLESATPLLAYCCCRADQCNIIPGLFGDHTPAPPIILPTPPVTAPQPSPGDELVCEFNNCSLPSNTECYHGYEHCSDSPDSIVASNHFCAVHAIRTSSGLYELRSKGCVITTDPTIASLGTGRPYCTLDTESTSDSISCYCDGFLCNNQSNMNFTDASRFVGTDPDVLCNSVGCSHSCVINNGVPRCLCPLGFALDAANLTICMDINECLVTHTHGCSHNCVNTIGSYRCECPLDSGLRLGLDGQICEQIPGLYCANHSYDCTQLGTCDDIVFCDQQLGPDADPDEHSCVAIVDYTTGTPDVKLQTCFSTPHNHPCSSGDECVAVEHPSIGFLYTCCCRTNLCNTRIVHPNFSATNPPSLPQTTTADLIETTPVNTAVTTISATPVLSSSQWRLPVFASITSVVVILAITVGIVVFFLCRHARSRKSEDSALHAMPIDNSIEMSTRLLPRANTFQNPPIGSGRFSIVYREAVKGEIRAVKVFQKKDKISYDREMAIYSQNNFKHSNILLFLMNNEYPDELQLIFQYHPNGCLYDLLTKQPISMKQFCNISTSAARGVAYLHTEIIRDGVLHKACVAHRDLKSKNILIKSDGTACISDFGLAIKWPIETYNEAQGQVGTARYMAPEYLEGAISFDREAYFRIDVYAFSLILWELTSRTKTNHGPVGEYRPPFDDVVPPNPSIEDMKKVVVDSQYRPAIPKAFTNHSEMDDVVNTIIETWDKDAEARLSAQCVYERLHTFSTKYESSKDKDSGYTISYDSTEPLRCTTPSLSGSSILFDSAKVPLSDVSTTNTGGAVPSVTHSSPQNNATGGRVEEGGRIVPHPQGANRGQNPMLKYPQRPAVNAAPPLHSPGEYQYRFVSAPSFPRHPPPSHHHQGPGQDGSSHSHTPSRTVGPSSNTNGHLRSSHPLSSTSQRTTIQFTNTNNIQQSSSPQPYHMESVV